MARNPNRTRSDDAWRWDRWDALNRVLDLVAYAVGCGLIVFAALELVDFLARSAAP